MKRMSLPLPRRLMPSSPRPSARVPARGPAEALKPVAGEFAFAIFTLGILGTGLLAVPVLAGSVLAKYATYYNEVRTHVSLGKDAPCTRGIERFGDIVAHPILGGLHHRYARI
jgi:hypothetical protein